MLRTKLHFTDVPTTKLRIKHASTFLKIIAL